MRTTLKQVADDAGLSIATVSRALRRKKRRYSANEEKIYAAARKLGYPFIGELDISVLHRYISLMKKKDENNCIS